MATNWVLIDYENVCASRVGVLDRQAFKVKAFLKATQTRMAVDFATAAQNVIDRLPLRRPLHGVSNDFVLTLG